MSNDHYVATLKVQNQYILFQRINSTTSIYDNDSVTEGYVRITFLHFEVYNIIKLE